jgi:hypothetical protein
MQHYVPECWIFIMPVRPPAGRPQIHFDITGLDRTITNLNHRAPEIWTAFDTVKTRMKHTYGLAVQCSELIAQQPLMLPDRLQQSFGRRIHILAQERPDAAAHTPLGI